MKRFKMLLMSAVSMLALAACVPAIAIAPPNAALPGSPASVANTTVLDERAAIAVEAAYLGAGSIIEAATDVGLIKGALAVRAEALDARAASWLGIARRAYDAGNADSYMKALDEAKQVIGELTSIGNRVQPKARAGERP